MFSRDALTAEDLSEQLKREVMFVGNPFMDSVLSHSNLKAQQISQASLVLVLFFGGLTTNWTAIRGVIKPAARLATVGVVITAALIGWAGFGLSAANGLGTNPATLPRVLYISSAILI